MWRLPHHSDICHNCSTLCWKWSGSKKEVKVHRILKVAHYFVFRNQNKRFVYWRARLDRKQEVNLKKCVLFLKQPYFWRAKHKQQIVFYLYLYICTLNKCTVWDTITTSNWDLKALDCKRHSFNIKVQNLQQVQDENFLDLWNSTFLRAAVRSSG